MALCGHSAIKCAAPSALPIHLDRAMAQAEHGRHQVQGDMQARPPDHLWRDSSVGAGAFLVPPSNKL